MLFFASVLLLTVNFLILAVIGIMGWDRKCEHVTRLMIVFYSLYFAMNIFLAGVDLIFLILYRKFSDRVHD